MKGIEDGNVQSISSLLDSVICPPTGAVEFDVDFESWTDFSSLSTNAKELLNMSLRNDMTLLIAAVSKDRDEVVALLLERGTNADKEDDYGNLSSMLAAKNGNNTIIELLIKKGADLHSKHKNGEDLLMIAAGAGELEIFEWLIGKYPDLLDVKKVDFSGRTVLMHAVAGGNHTFVERLLELGADPDLEEGYDSPVVKAAENGDSEMIELLMGHAEYFNEGDRRGNIALQYAIRGRHFDVVSDLIDRNAALVDPDGIRDLLETAVSKNALDTFNLLIESMEESDIESSIKGLGNVLQHPVKAGNRTFVERLLELGVDPFAKDLGLLQLPGSHEGCTLLMVAAYNNRVEIIDFLVERGADINAQDSEGSNALWYAAKKGHYDVGEALIRLGSDKLRGANSFERGMQGFFEDLGANETVRIGSEDILALFQDKEHQERLCKLYDECHEDELKRSMFSRLFRW